MSGFPVRALLCLLAVMACALFFESAPSPAPAQPMTEAELGRLAFHDPILSASGKQSCASCHAESAGHAAPNALAVQPGGADLSASGLRASQSLRYLASNVPFHFDAEGKALGGFFWDGRAESFAAQAAGPLLGPLEMANPDRASVVEKIAKASWAGAFKALYGADILRDTDRAFERLTAALQRFQLEDAQFNAYSSKYDAVLRGQATLNEQEARGLALFNDEHKGNCAACHPSDKNADGSHPLFTDFSYDNLGVPRNPEIAANANAEYFDLGLCNRPELRSRDELCGAFRVPSLRNVALRQVYFHNGRFRTLKEAMVFYVERDTHPHKWYPKNADGTVRKFDDLPERFHANVNSSEGPYDRKAGEAPALDAREIDDIIAFLNTLTDGWSPASPQGARR